jgi:hypothetical protein
MSTTRQPTFPIHGPAGSVTRQFIPVSFKAASADGYGN